MGSKIVIKFQSGIISKFRSNFRDKKHSFTFSFCKIFRCLTLFFSDDFLFILNFLTFNCI